MNNCNAFLTYYFMNCKLRDHASSNRSCPDFNHHPTAMDDKTPENLCPTS
ncbi:hypothetical protein ID866_8429 [Astraeus odoratus]|nr:hypothetical protein ID866_8429 [Astraeus odoratus]